MVTPVINLAYRETPLRTTGVSGTNAMNAAGESG
jgi:hypothetical protein